MSNNNDSIKHTLIVSFALCLVCSIIVSGVAVALKPQQQENKLADLRRNVLSIAGLYDPSKKVNDQFAELLEPKLVDLRTGEYSDAQDPNTYDQRSASKDPERSRELTADEDKGKIIRRAHYAVVYQVTQGENKGRMLLPIHGYGLWSTLYGYVALESDLSTVAGFGFYEHGETPGLGGEVDNPKWKASWEGKQMFDAEGQPQIRLVKGGARPGSASEFYDVDSLSGATLTTNGIKNLVDFWMGDLGFGPFIAKLKEEGQVNG